MYIFLENINTKKHGVHGVQKTENGPTWQWSRYIFFLKI